MRQVGWWLESLERRDFERRIAQPSKASISLRSTVGVTRGNGQQLSAQAAAVSTLSHITCQAKPCAGPLSLTSRPRYRARGRCFAQTCFAFMDQYPAAEEGFTSGIHSRDAYVRGRPCARAAPFAAPHARPQSSLQSTAQGRDDREAIQAASLYNPLRQSRRPKKDPGQSRGRCRTGPLEDRNMAGKMATWGPQSCTADECSLTWSEPRAVSDRPSSAYLQPLQRGTCQ